jgi:S1-C subfamily serine protease
MTQQTGNRTITLSYGALALLLLGAVLIGLISGLLGGGIAGSYVAGRDRARPVPDGSTGASDRAWLGMTYVPLTQAVAKRLSLTVHVGAYVVTVAAGSPAERAGLLQGDIITAVDQRPVGDSTGAADVIMDVIRGKKPDDHLQLTILRDGAPQSLDVVLGHLPQTSFQPNSRTPLQRLYEYLMRRFGSQ